LRLALDEERKNYGRPASAKRLRKHSR
jgi:hypothetical protein